MFIRIFLILSFLLFCFLLLGTFFLYRSKNLFIRDKSVAFSAIVMGLYVISCFVGIIFVNLPTKIILLLCGISPFVIGKFATYKKILFFTFVQLFVILGGIIYVLKCMYVI